MNTSLDQWVVRIAGAAVLLSLLLAYLHSPIWFWATAFVGANLFQSSFTGFCALEKLLSALGIEKSHSVNSRNH